MDVFLNNGIRMPLLGLGCWDMHGNEAQQAVESAIEIGYRLIDTAAMYGNEKEVGKGITQSGIPRENIFITTKVNNADQGCDNTLRAYSVSCRHLQVDYVDLYLIHWPLKETRKDTWKALENLYEERRVRAIGVCNYHPAFLKELDMFSDVMPMVNQCEFSPYLYDEDLLNACKERNIILQAWAPLLRGQKFDDPKLVSLANKYDKAPAQILIRWAIQQGISSIPKSSSVLRLKDNFNVFDFNISESDIDTMNSFHEGFRMSGEDPMNYW